MSKTKEALEMAIEICEFYRGNGDNDIDKCLNACKEALQELALDRMAENARELGLEWEGEQEPVYIVGQGWQVDKELQVGTPLYTRPTQPLSDDEVKAEFEVEK